MLIDRKQIDKAKSMLGERNAEIIFEELGIYDYDKKNLKCKCPFHTEDTASFIYNRKTNSFHCFGACGRSYDLIDVLMIKKNYTFIDATKKLFDYANMPYSFGEQGVKTKRYYKYPHEEPLNNKDIVTAYLAKRKISRATIDYLDIREANGNIVFNYYDTNDVLTMVKYRPAGKVVKGSGKSKCWCQPGADTSALLYNMNRINISGSLMITCGELDCASAIEAGWTNVVSIPLGDQNTHWCDENKEWLDQFDDIIVCADNDASGSKFLKTVVPMLRTRRCRICNIPVTVEITNEAGQTITKRVKDLNEYLYYMGPEKVMDVIGSASYSPIMSVADLSDVTPIEYDDVDGVNFGIKSLDDEIVRLFFSTLTVISGRPGSGKSSLLGQLICTAMDQGYNTWLFSGELPNGMNKSWMNYILAGRRNIELRTSTNGREYYTVTSNAMSQINEHYRGRWMIYKDDLDNDLNSLLNSMEEVVCRKAVKLLILDNFMCIDNSSDGEELRSQTDTIKRLIKFAKEWQVAIVLVCHPRKFERGLDMENDDIAGTSNIINLAHRTISIKRVYEKDRQRATPEQEELLKYDVIFRVMKDRMFGRMNIDKGAYYDPIDRRFYSTEDEYDRNYEWDKTQYTDRLISEKFAYQDDSEVFGDMSIPGEDV